MLSVLLQTTKGILNIVVCTAEFSGPFNSVLNKILRESVLYLCSIACKKQEEPIEYLEYSLLITKNHFISLNFYTSIINPLPPLSVLFTSI